MPFDSFTRAGAFGYVRKWCSESAISIANGDNNELYQVMTNAANGGDGGLGCITLGLGLLILGVVTAAPMEVISSYGHLRNLITVVVFVALCVLVWKKRNQITPKRMAAMYLGWVFLNLSLLFFSPASPWSDQKKYYIEEAREVFYPFISSEAYNGKASGIFFDKIMFYDSTEFFLYVIGPVFVWGVVRLWRSGKPDAT